MTTETAASATSGAEREAALADQGKLLCFALYQAYKVSHFHEFENQAMEGALGHLTGAVDALITAEGKATIADTEGHLFVNGRRVVASGGALQTVGEIVALLEKKGLGGLRLERRLDRAGLKTLLSGIGAIPAGTPDGPGYLRLWLAGHEGADLGIAGLKPRGSGGSPTVAVPLTLRARLLYAKLLVLLREVLGPAADHPPAHTFLVNRLRRTLQEIVSTSDEAPLAYLGLINVKSYESALANHSANAAILSVLVGRKLGLERHELCDLGVAAALHDVGRLDTPAHLLSKQGELRVEERRALTRYPVDGVRRTLRHAAALDKTTMARLVATFEHTTAQSGYPERRETRSLHLFSRILAVVDAYDAMTTARPYRRALLPDEALGEIRRGIGSRFDPLVVHAFTDLLGVYPQGTMVVLARGERGIVIHSDLSDVSNPRPIVKIVMEADGRRTQRIVDVGERDGKGGYAHTIIGTDDPARYAISVAAYAAE